MPTLTLLFLAHGFFPIPAAAALSGVSASSAAFEAQSAYAASLLAEGRGAYASAFQDLEKAAAADPSSPFLARQAAKIALGLGNLTKAEAYARAALKVNALDPEALVLLGRVEWARGQFTKSQDRFEKALRIQPSSEEATFSLASLLVRTSTSSARDLLDRFLKENPSKAPQTYLALAQLYLNERDYEKAARELQSSIALYPGFESIPARFSLAQLYEASGSTVAAIQEYLQIVRVQPHDLRLIDHIGELDIEAGDPQAARAAFNAAKSLEPADPIANLWLAQFAEDAGRPIEAARFLSESAALPKDPTLWLKIAYLQMRGARADDGLQTLREALSRFPRNARVAYFLGMAYEDRGRNGKALRALRAAVQDDPGNDQARYALAAAEEQAGDIAAAEKEFRRLIARNPKNPEILNYLGYSLADRGLKLQEARDLVERALAIEPTNGAYIDSLGWVYYKEGRYREALKELDLAHAAMPYDETILDHRGDAAAAAKDYETAWSSWMRSASLPASAGARRKSLLAKARRIEAGLGPQTTGRLYLAYLRQSQGSAEKLSGLCALEGSLLGHRFAFETLLDFRQPATLNLDLLGPLFTPFFRAKVSSETIAMDPVDIPGLSPRTVESNLRETVLLFYDFLSGAAFGGAEAKLVRHWFSSPSLETPSWVIRLSRDGLFARSITPNPSRGARLDLSLFEPLPDMRLLPRVAKVVKRGLRASLILKDVHAPAPK